MTPLLPTTDHYLFNMLAMTSSDAKRIRKQAIKEHFNHRCVYCGIQHPSEHLTIDHVRPRSRGGTDQTNNLVPSCRKCNMAKGSRNWLQFMREAFGPSTERESLILSWIN